MNKVRQDQLIGKYLFGALTNEEHKELDLQLVQNPSIGRRVAELSIDEFLLVEMGDVEQLDAVTDRVKHVKYGQKFRFARSILALAASIALIAVVWRFGVARRNYEERSLVANIVKVVGGESWLMEVDSQRRVIKVGDAVREGDRIETGKTGKVVLAYLLGAKVKLGAGSELRVGCLTPNIQSSTSRLERGVISADVAKQSQGNVFLLETPQALVTVRGTRFNVKISEEFMTTSQKPGKGGATRLDMKNGLVTFMRLSDGAEIDVVAGQYAVAADGVDLVAMSIMGIPNKTKTGSFSGQPDSWARDDYDLGPIIFEENFDQGLGKWELLAGPDLENLTLVGDESSEIIKLSRRKISNLYAGFLDGYKDHGVVKISFYGERAAGRVLCFRTKEPITEEAFSVKWFVDIMTFKDYACIFPLATVYSEEKYQTRYRLPSRHFVRWDCVPAGRASDGRALMETRTYIKDLKYKQPQVEGLLRTRIISSDDRRLCFTFSDGAVRLLRVEVRRLVKK